MSLCGYFEREKIKLPAYETCDGLNSEDLIKEVRSFYLRLDKSHGLVCEFAEGFHLDLLARYPVSMCRRDISDTLAYVMALIYYTNIPSDIDMQEYRIEYAKWERQEKWERSLRPPDEPVQQFSMEDLAVIFNRSRATVFQALKRKENEVHDLVQNTKLREEAREEARKLLIEEEKAKLKEKKNEEIAEETNIHKIT